MNQILLANSYLLENRTFVNHLVKDSKKTNRHID